MIQRESSGSKRARIHGSPAGPVRTCIGCRKRELAVELLRVVAVPDGAGRCAVTVDAAGNLPGRGAWLHPRWQCVQAAIRRRAFARALRITGSPDVSGVAGHFGESPPDGEPPEVRTPRRREQVAKNMSTP